jgi:hypothetical protein
MIGLNVTLYRLSGQGTKDVYKERTRVLSCLYHSISECKASFPLQAYTVLERIKYIFKFQNLVIVD